MAASDAFQLDPAFIDELAVRLSDVFVKRFVEVLRAEGFLPQAHAARDWLDAQDVAKRLRVSREWVYEHADELGASRIGTGPRPRLRFPPQILDVPRDNQPSAEAASRQTERRPTPSGLIPVHDA